MTTARKVLAGGAWLYGAQFLSILAQLIYAAITSRLAGSTDFGAYAVALSVSGFATMVATSGLGQAVGRMKEIHPRVIQSLVSYALLIGALGALLLVLSAPLWALLYASDNSVAISFTAILTLTAPLFGLATGLLRRLGRFRVLALATLLANLTGMAVGAICVYFYPSAVTLLVSATLAQLLVLGFAMTNARHHLCGLRPLREARSEIAYSWQLIGSNVMAWSNANFVKIFASRTFGVGAIGQWNRAEALTTVPFHQGQAALVQAVYPEFRNFHESSATARRVWTDLLVLVSWLVLPAAAILSAIAPTMVVFMFGPGWQDAAWISSVLALVGGVQILNALLGSAIESLGRFRWIWLNHAIVLLLQIGIVAAILLVGELWVAILGALLTVIACHTVQVACSARGGYVTASRLIAQYLLVAATSIVVYGLTSLAVYLLGGNQDLILVVVLLTGLFAVFACSWMFRRRIPPIVIAKRYGIF